MAQTSHRNGPCGMKRQTPVVTRLISAMGSMNFQAKLRSWSIRSRGTVLRIQINMTISAKSFAKNQRYDGIQPRTENGADHPPRNSVIANPLIANIPIYSPRKNSWIQPLPQS
jgi:hypothetical protein